MKQVRDIMTSNIEVLGPTATIKQAATAMRQADTGSIPIVDNGQLVGIVTDRDLAIRGLSEGLGPDSEIGPLMSADPLCCYEQDDAEQVANRMAVAQVRRLPVLGEGDLLVGMVSLGDLSREGKQKAASEALQGVSAESSSDLQPA